MCPQRTGDSTNLLEEFEWVASAELLDADDSDV